MKKKTGLSLTVATGIVAATLPTLHAQQVIPVWPEGKIPLKTSDAPERVNPTNDNIIHLTDVNVPTLTCFPAEDKGSPNPAVVICPGGAYVILALDLEGTEVAAWLNKQGITAFVLKYRVPGNRDAALCDAQRSVGLIRARAKEYNVNPAKIGIMGFSAGGHLSVRASTNHGKRFYEPVDAADEVSCRPDFTMVVYPAYLSGENYRMSEGLPVAADTPPALIVQTQDDTSFINSSLCYYIALKDAKVPVEMHLFPDGGHGYGLRPRNTSSDTWPPMAEAWLKRISK